jgi:hypothetical protein
MVFSLVSRVVNGVKGGVVASLQGVADISGSIANVIKDIVVNAFEDTSDFVKAGIEIPASIVSGAFLGIGEIGATTTGAVKGIVKGTIQGFMHQAPKSEEIAVKGAVSQAIFSAKEMGLDVGKAAVESVLGAIGAAKEIGLDVTDITKTSIVAALDAGKHIGGDSFNAVKSSLSAGVEGANKIIESI